MENQEKTTEKALYLVYDEMACENLLETNNAKLANDTAYNHQAVLINNITGRVITDYSC